MSYSQVYDLYNGQLVGYLGDINLLGAMVIGDEQMKTDATLTISIQLPELPEVTATRIAMPVRVAYCKRDLSPEYFNIGLEFNSIAFDDIASSIPPVNSILIHNDGVFNIVPTVRHHGN